MNRTVIRLHGRRLKAEYAAESRGALGVESAPAIQHRAVENHPPIRSYQQNLAFMADYPKPKAQLTGQEFKVISLRDWPLPEDMMLCDKPDISAEYWRSNV